MMAYHMPMANPRYFHLSAHITSTSVFRKMYTFTSQGTQAQTRNQSLKRIISLDGH